jgi:hypothetical protein
MGADNTIALDVARTASGVEIRPGGGQPPIAWSEPAPLGPVTAYFRDDVAKRLCHGNAFYLSRVETLGDAPHAISMV